MLLLIIIVIVSYVLLHTLEIACFGARVAGRLTNRAALGTSLSQTVYTIADFLLIIFLPALAYIVESGITINDYLTLVLVAYILTFIVSIIMLIKLNSLQHFYQVIFAKYNDNTVPIAILKSLISKKTDFNAKDCANFTFDKIVLKKTLVSFLAYIFLITGFFIAFMLAVLFPENRLTLSQFTAAFHGFGAVIFAFYLDPMLSRSIDTYSDNATWLKNVYSILFGRVLSYLAIIIALLIFLYYLNSLE
jgi:hypothetical protein